MVYYIFKFFLIIIAAFPFYLLFRRPWKRGRERECVLGIFVLFMSGVLALALEGTYQSPALMIQSARQRLATGFRINLIPFHTIRAFFRHFIPGNFLVNIVGNIVMFIPWGFGLPLLWKKRQSVFSAVFFSALLPLLIETTQLFIQRSVDVDDLILNFAGGLLGFALFFFFRRKGKNMEHFAR